MADFIEVKATRNYDISLARGISRCDLCKGYKLCFEFTPEKRLHNFDNLFLCRGCSDKCGFDTRDGVLDELNDDKGRN